MKKRIIISVGVIFLMGILIFRIYTVNKDVKLPVVKEFALGEVVPFETDFNNTSDDAVEGYAIKVIESELLTTVEFYERYNIASEDAAKDNLNSYYYVVRTLVENQNNQEGTQKGVGVTALPLVGTNYYMIADTMMFEIINPEMPNAAFSLNPDTSKEVLIPYGVHSTANPEREVLVKHPPKMQVTEYPNRKLVAIE